MSIAEEADDLVLGEGWSGGVIKPGEEECQEGGCRVREGVPGSPVQGGGI